jgi:protocatechuate 3,4-dioxygenase beta subunit
VGYTTGTSPGPIIITAAVNALTTQFAENVSAGPPASVTVSGGNNQTGNAGSTLAQALTVIVADQYGNPVPGVSVYYSDNGAGGTFSSPNPSNTNGSGIATESYTLSPFTGSVTITATATGVNNPATFAETSVAGPAAYIYVISGNNQTAPAGTQLPQCLKVSVTDQYGNPVSGVNVGFDDGGAGGSFSGPNPVATNNSGNASEMYTLPASPGTVTINATAAGVSTPAVFTETGQ